MKDKEIHIKGTCKDQFFKVKDAFIGNFRNMGEIGARVSIIQENETGSTGCYETNFML